MENRIFYNFVKNHAFNGGVHFLMGEVTKITRLWHLTSNICPVRPLLPTFIPCSNIWNFEWLMNNRSTPCSKRGLLGLDSFHLIIKITSMEWLMNNRSTPCSKRGLLGLDSFHLIIKTTSMPHNKNLQLKTWLFLVSETFSWKIASRGELMISKQRKSF